MAKYSRTAKKVAKRYLDGKDVSRWIIGEEEDFFNKRTEYVFPGKIRLAIRKEAVKRGWDGCHWDNPFVKEYWE